MLEGSKHRVLSVLALGVLLFGACSGGGDNDADSTRAPDRSPEPARAVAEFQLVGSIDEAFSGQQPDIDIADEASSTSANESASPSAPAVGATASTPGIMRITIEDLSEELASSCDVAADESVEVFWTTQTHFEPDDVLDDIEDEIEDRVAGVSGSIYRATASSDDDDADTDDADDGAIGPRPSRSAELGAGNCVLVAEQVGFTRGSTLPTPRAVTRRTASPTGADRTSSPSPDASPSPSKTPKDTPTAPPATSTKTAEPSPDETP